MAATRSDRCKSDRRREACSRVTSPPATIAVAALVGDNARVRGHAPFGSVDIITRALLDEFPELDRERLRAAVERATAKAAGASLDTEGYRVVDLHLARAEAAEQSDERAQILRELSDTLAERDDADRALVVRLAAF